jgi:eukaryotic-like serine/threonine-protein kinase
MAKGKLILDRYRLLGEAGAGGYGTVMVAKDPRIQRKVAIKAIPLTEIDALRAALPGAEAVSDPVRLNEARGRFGGLRGSSDEQATQVVLADSPADDDEATVDVANAATDEQDVRSLAHIPGLDEARTAAMLSDPHIVTVYDVEVRDRTAYLVMEYIEGITLSKLLRDYADYLTIDMVTAVFDSVAAALKKAHARRVLHLDIKPDNILINRDGQVKVTDFGLATLVDASGVGTTGGGTIGYMPPEQMRREELDMRTDEWALASVVYEMLTGSNPFIVPELSQAERAIDDAELVLPSLCWDNLDAGIDDALFYALDPVKDERYETVLDFQEEVDRFLGDAAEGTAQLKYVVNDALDTARAASEGDDGAAEPGLASADAGESDEAPEEDPYAIGRARMQRKAERKAERRERAQQRRLDKERAGRKQRAPRKPLKQRLTPSVQKRISRVFGAVASGLLAFFALANMTFFRGWLVGASVASTSLAQASGGVVNVGPLAIMIAISLGVAVLGAVMPHAGALTGFCMLSLAFILGANPVLGIVLLVASAAWWFFVGRTGVAEPNVAMALPVVGAFGFSAFLPLAAGTCLKPRNAFITLAFSALWAVALGACGTGNLLGWDALANWNFSRIDVQGEFVRMLTMPATWCIIASWLAAVVAESACNGRREKGFAVLGVVLAAALLIAGAFAAAWFDAGMRAAYPALNLMLPIVVSAAIMLAVVVALK